MHSRWYRDSITAGLCLMCRRREMGSHCWDGSCVSSVDASFVAYAPNILPWMAWVSAGLSPCWSQLWLRAQSISDCWLPTSLSFILLGKVAKDFPRKVEYRADRPVLLTRWMLLLGFSVFNIPGRGPSDVNNFVTNWAAYMITDSNYRDLHEART